MKTPAGKRAAVDAYQRLNPDRVKASKARQNAKRTPEDTWRSWLRSAHKMTLEEYAAMVTAQGARCYLCRDPLLLDRGKRGTHIDHDHRCCPSGKSCSRCRRGLACNRCNMLIGWADDDPVKLRLIAGNLEMALKILSLEEP